MRTTHLWILALCFLKLCDGYELTCTVSADARGVLYSVQQFRAEECWHSWADENDITLANHLQQDKELVVMQTNHTLLLKKCERLVYYRRNCLSEKGPFRATCHASCVESADLVPLANRQTNWRLIAVVISVILVLLVGGVLCFMFRAGICRGDCFHSALKGPTIQNRRQSMEEGIPF